MKQEVFDRMKDYGKESIKKDVEDWMTNIKDISTKRF